MFTKTLISLIFISWSFCSTTLECVNTDKNMKPQILLFTCQYGSGHKMAAQGIVESLPNYSVAIVDIYDEPLNSIDPFRKSFPAISVENIYNKIAKNENNYLLNFFSNIAPRSLLWQRIKIEHLLESYIAKEKPDMIISCVPLVDSMLLNVSKKLDIPLLVISTDIDISWFAYGFDKVNFETDINKFRITFPYSEKYFKKRNSFPKWLLDSIEYNFGYPTRASFSQSADESTLNEIRKKYSIADDENIILIMMGSNGSKATLEYAKLLIGMTEDQIRKIDDKKIHILALCGDVKQKENLELMKRLNALNSSRYKRNKIVKIQAIPKTHQIAELVSLPNLRTVISKPGGSTVNEMIKKRIPMVYHIQGVPLDWERGNMEYGETRSFGKRFYLSKTTNRKNRDNLINVLRYTFLLKQKLTSTYEADIDFSENLRKALREML